MPDKPGNTSCFVSQSWKILSGCYVFIMVVLLTRASRIAAYGKLCRKWPLPERSRKATWYLSWRSVKERWRELHHSDQSLEAGTPRDAIWAMMPGHRVPYLQCCQNRDTVGEMQLLARTVVIYSSCSKEIYLEREKYSPKSPQKTFFCLLKTSVFNEFYSQLVKALKSILQSFSAFSN